MHFLGPALACFILLSPAHPWDLEALGQPPAVHPAPLTGEGVEGIFYEAVPWQGKPTRVFAWLGLPEASHGARVPAMVLAHGGGGTAYDEWVRRWTARGYAALAMDLEGCLPEGEFPNRTRHAWSGPSRAGDFADIDGSPEEQWYYHAVAAILLAHSLLRAHPDIDPGRIGLTGISWGGILAATVAGVDPRFQFIIPVYGCGFLNEAPVFQHRWQQLGPERAARWHALWDPASHLPRATAPMLWVNGANDLHFPLDIHARSFALAPVPKVLSVRVDMKHSHPHGWAPEEIHAFADSMTTPQAPPMPRILGTDREGRQVWLEHDPEASVVEAALIVCTAPADLVACAWESLPVQRVSAERLSATLPASQCAWFFNLTDSRGLVVSSPVAFFVERGDGVVEK